MIPKSKIRLSRSLHAQTTPYPEAGRWVKRFSFLLVTVLAVGIYLVARAPGQEGRGGQYPDEPTKQILGQQQGRPVNYLLYEVKKGDTLFNLSTRFNISWQTLAEINNLKDPYLLRIGQEIKIPPPRFSP